MKLYYEYGLPFAEIEFFNEHKSVKLSRVLIDTGSATTIISTETAISLGLSPMPDDKLNLVRGVGGVESVYEKYVEKIILDTVILKNFKIDVGAMQYGFEIDAIVGMDVFEHTKAIINFSEMTLTPVAV